MPKATVYEDGEAMSWEDDVGGGPKGLPPDRDVLAKAQTAPV
jgi:hypothetical protein